MIDSILTSVKKVLGLTEDYTAFDEDILMHINSVFSTLNQLGIGPENGFEIEDDAPTWDAFIGGDKRFNFVKTYIVLKVRVLFDPPTTGYHMEAAKEQIAQYEWRINALRETYAWVDPNPGPLPFDHILDGGDAED